MEELHFTRVAPAVVADDWSLLKTCQHKLSNIRIRGTSKAANKYIRLKRAGAALVLTWAFVNLVIYNFIMTALDTYYPSGRMYVYISFMVIPVSGLIADSYVGRYNFIQFCYRIMWLVSLLLTATYLVQYLPINADSKTIKGLKIAWFFLLLICMGSSTVNMIQFGIDQLQDAPSSDIIVYLKWYSWTYFASVCTVIITQSCTCEEFQTVVSLVPFTLLSLVLCSDYLFHKILVKEPVMKNAFRLIFGVLKFSLLNKFPQMPSSYADWSSKGLCSRLNLAKTIFGGPYSNEDVENVKTFFRICIIFLFSAIILTAVLSIEMMTPGFSITIPQLCSDYATCLLNQIRIKSGYFFISLLIPVYLMLHWVRKHLPYLKILTRLTIGGFCCMLSLIIILSIMSSHQLPSSKNHISPNSTKTEEENANYWFILPSLLNSIGMYLGMVSGNEFICAQCPYRMKGLIYGLLYFCLGCGFSFFSIVDMEEVISIIPDHYSILLNLTSYKLVINISIVLLFGIVGIGGVCCYKVRSREDSS